MQAEVMPKFNGGEVQDFRTWVMSQIHYPESMVKGKIQGRMLVEFVINKEGKLTDFHVIKELHKDASEQVADVLSKSPLWTPGQNNGKAVSMKFILPLDFRLSSPHGMRRQMQLQNRSPRQARMRTGPMRLTRLSS